MEGVRIEVAWTRAELTAMREAIELTPHFSGRLEAREVIRAALRPGLRPRPIVFERDTADRFARRLVTGDLPTALAKVKLMRAIRETSAEPAPYAEQDTRAA